MWLLMPKRDYRVLLFSGRAASACSETFTVKESVCRQFVPGVGGKQIPALEVLETTAAIRNMIREDKLHQLESAMQAGAADGMRTMGGSLLRLYKEGRISRDTALVACVNDENMVKRLG